ncbi:MAG: hypothetical protein Q9218_004521 [Villophora microphyllina]
MNPTSTGSTNAAPTGSTRPSSASPASASSAPGGQIMGASQEEAFVASMCSPLNTTKQPDMNFPCNKFALYEIPCVYGKSYEDLLKNGGSDSPAPSLRSPNDQLTCLCTEGGQGQNYWQNSFDCSECRRLHGASVENLNDYAPAPYVKAFSSAYCAQAPSSAAALLDYATIWTSTGTVNLGTSTGGSDVLGSSTAVSLYAASTSSSLSTTKSAALAATATSTNISQTGPGSPSKTGAGRKTSSGSGMEPLATSGILGIVLLGIVWAENPSSTSSSAVHERSSPIQKAVQSLSSPPTLLEPDQASYVTSSPPHSGSIPQQLALDNIGKGNTPIPESSNTASSSPSTAYAQLTIENQGVQEPFGPDAVNSKGRLSSLSVAEARGGPSFTVRSSSPAKRRASQMDGTSNGNPADDIDMEDTLAQDTQNRRTNVSREPAKAQRRRSSVQQSRHKREMSLDPLASEVIPTEGSPLPDRSRSGSNSHLAGAYLTPQSGASTTSIGQRDASDAQPSSGLRATEMPSIDDQISQVWGLAGSPPREGQRGFVISYKWLGRVMARGSNPAHMARFGKEAVEGPIGPVDNSGLEMVIDQSMRNLKDEMGQPFIPLRPELGLGDQIEILPEEAWELILRWYGLAQGSPIITRFAHNTSDSKTQENVVYELKPPIFTIVKLPDVSDGMTKQALDEKDALPFKMLATRSRYFQAFLKDAKQGARINIKKKVRVWRILGGLSVETANGIITPAQSRSNSPALNTTAAVDPGNHLILDLYRFAELQMGSERELIETKDETANEKYNGHLSLVAVGLGQDSVVVLEEQIGGPAGGEWVAEAALNKAKANGVPISITKSGATKVQDNLKLKADNSRTASPARSGMMTRGRARKDGRARGTIGLSNLGNTCYMNSALQCIRSCEELSMYFLHDVYKRELNPSNPLSHNGMVAKAYASLIREIYSDSTQFAFAPKNFKNVIGRYGPSFSGYGQQDSQEFLLFLLDGLQEDLNRIQKKPYIEKPDSTDEMVNNPAALKEMASKCWDIYKARNDSVVTDLFAGMYKSTVVCPVCDKVSIIFDPFNNLTLQLPIENVWSRQLDFFPLHTHPFRLDVDVDKNSTFKELKAYVGRRVGVDAQRLIIAEVYKNRFYKVFKDEDTIGEERIQEADIITVFELEDVPTNWPRPKKPGQQKSIYYSNNNNSDEDLPSQDSPQADKMLVTVHHRHTKIGATRSQPQREVFGVPGMIVVSREEAKSEDAILRKVLAQVETLTSRDFLREFDDSDPSPEDSDTVLMGTEEGDSSSDSKVQAQSVDSEDGMVDISMAESASNSHTQSHIRYPPSNLKVKPLAKMLQPGSFITPEVRNLFELKYHTSGDTVPTSFGSMNEDGKEMPTIASRSTGTRPIRRPNTSAKLQQRLRRSSSDVSSDEDAEEVPEPVHPFQRENTASGSDDEDLPPVQQLIQRPHQGFSRFSRITPRTKKVLITYSRQGKNRSDPPSRDPVEPQSENDYLIKLGEQIYVDWSNEGLDALFHGSTSSQDGEESMRGLPTYDDMPLRSDPELDDKRRLRAQRRKNGVTLNDCLDEFGKAEILSENDAWYCPRCKEHRRASKQFELWTAPDILVIHLKRFSSQGRMRDKLDVAVDFPVEGLDLTDRVKSQGEGRGAVYDLFAVDNHYGGLGGGHYTAAAQSFYDKVWYDYNGSQETVKLTAADSQVSRRNPQAVVSSAAYLLFYRRRSEQPLGGPFFERIMSGTDDSAAESDPNSDNAFLPGEGKRLDGSSHNGSSSALRGVGAAHQVGGGGDALTARRTGVDDDLPSYPGQDVDEAPDATLETMDLDEGVGGVEDIYAPLNQFGQGSLHQSWSFSRLPNEQEQLQVVRAPAASEDGGSEKLFDGDSTKAASSPPSEIADRLAEFADDEGTTSGAFGPAMGETPLQVEPPLLNDEDEPVAEVTLAEGDTMFKE